MRIFAVALSYGVMVAQQVLVLFVVVRIRLGQLKRRLFRVSVFVFIYCCLVKLIMWSKTG